MMKTSSVAIILYILSSMHLLMVIYLLFTLPSIPTLFADEGWVTPQIAQHKDRGTLEEFVLAATRSTKIVQKSALTHLIGSAALSLLTMVLSGCAIFVLRKREPNAG